MEGNCPAAIVINIVISGETRNQLKRVGRVPIMRIVLYAHAASTLLTNNATACRVVELPKSVYLGTL